MGPQKSLQTQLPSTQLQAWGAVHVRRREKFPYVAPVFGLRTLKAAEGLGTEHTTHSFSHLTEGKNLRPRQESEIGRDLRFKAKGSQQKRE